MGYQIKYKGTENYICNCQNRTYDSDDIKDKLFRLTLPKFLAKKVIKLIMKEHPDKKLDLVKQ